MKYILQIIYYGYGILIIAAFINWMGKNSGLKSWYDVLEGMRLKEVSFFNLVWLIAVYPLFLGAGFLFLKILRRILWRGK